MIRHQLDIHCECYTKCFIQIIGYKFYTNGFAKKSFVHTIVYIITVNKKKQNNVHFTKNIFLF